MNQIPLFPLGTVLFPGGRLSLQIFEQRYLELVSESSKRETGFGVAWIVSGQEVAQPGSALPELAARGTYARIVDWDSTPNGLLGITVEGREMFQIDDCFFADNQLVMGNVEMLPAAKPEPLREEWAPVLEVLRQLERHPPVQRMGLVIDYGDSWHVGRALAQVLPLEPAFKYELLQIDDVDVFMERIGRIANSLSE